MELGNRTDIEVLKKEVKKHYVDFGIQKEDNINGI